MGAAWKNTVHDSHLLKKKTRVYHIVFICFFNEVWLSLISIIIYNLY